MPPENTEFQVDKIHKAYTTLLNGQLGKFQKFLHFGYETRPHMVYILDQLLDT